MIRWLHPWVFSKGTFESACHHKKALIPSKYVWNRLKKGILSEGKMEDKKGEFTVYLKSLKIHFENIS